MKYDYSIALTIALKGKYRMQTEVAEGKYTIAYIAEGEFTVTKDNGTEYKVSVFINPDDRRQSFGSCSCPFCNYGEENQTCKHIEFCLDLLDWDQVWKPDGAADLATALTRAAQEEAEDAYYDELEAHYGGRPYLFSDSPEMEGDARLYKMFG